MLDLRGAESKLRRAHTHAFELQNGARRYLNTDSMSLEPYENSEVMECGWLLVTRQPPPDELASIGADMVNALRTALNYCVWQAYLAAGGDPTEKGSARVQFPVTSDPDDWHRVAGDMLRRITGPALEIVRAAQPFARPAPDHDLLMDLVGLSNEDKHRQPQVCAVARISTEIVWAPLPEGLYRTLGVSADQLGVEANVAQPAVWVQLVTAPGQVPRRRPDMQMQLPPPPIVELGLVGEGRQVPVSRLLLLVAEVERIVGQFALQ